MRRPDYIRWTVMWIGVGAIALGAVLLADPLAMHGANYNHLRQLTPAIWGAIWGALGATVAVCAAVAWPRVLVPLAAVTGLMCFWAAAFIAAALADHGRGGYVGAVVWLWFAGTVWFAAIRAARTPNP